MPGLLDNQNNGQGGGILQGLGNYFNNIATNMAGPDAVYRQKAYQALARQNGPDDAAILMGNPEAYGMGFQRQLFINQLQSLMGPDFNNPRMSLNEALYRLSQAGQKQQYGYEPGQPIEPAPGVKIPTYIHGGQPVIGIPGASIQGQPSQQPQPQQAQGPAQSPSGVAQLQPYIDWAQKLEAQRAAGVKAAEQTATAQPDLPILQSRAQEAIDRLQKIKNNPELPNVIGGPLGIKGRTGPIGQTQSDLLSDIQDANNALQGDLFTSMRTISNGGRAPSIGAMKEMRITDLNARTGTLQAYKDNLDKTSKQIQNEYEAAWKARGSPDTYKPNWGQSQPQQTFPAPTAAHIQALKAQPQRAADFDSKFGQGAAMRVLGR